MALYTLLVLLNVASMQCYLANCESNSVSCIENKFGSECVKTALSDPETETERRRRIAEKYLSSLSENRDDWLDPTDMINYKGLDYGKVFDIPEIVTIINKKIGIGDDAASAVQNFDKELPNDRKELANDNKELDNSNKINTNLGGYSDSVQHKEMVLLTEETKKKMRSYNDIYLSRWLNRLFSKISYLKHEKIDSSYIQFPISQKFLSVLTEILQKQPLNVQELDDIIDAAIGDSVITHDSTIFKISPTFDFISSNSGVIIVMVIILSFVVLYCSIVRSPKLTIVVLFVGMSIFWHWMQLYQQKLADKHYHLESMDFKDECITKDFGTLKKVKMFFTSFFTSGNECEKYYRALMVDPIWEVSLSVAASEAFASCVFQPLKVLSRVCNYCVKELFADLNIFHIVFIVVFTMFLLIIIFNYRVRFPWFFATLEPAGNTSQVQEIAEAILKYRNLPKEIKLVNIVRSSKSPEIVHELKKPIEEKTEMNVVEESCTDQELVKELCASEIDEHEQKACSLTSLETPKNSTTVRCRNVCNIDKENVSLTTSDEIEEITVAPHGQNDDIIRDEKNVEALS